MKIINIYKPKGWTSFDVVSFLKKKFNEKKVGHLGTLDPLATGVLPVFMGKATKLIPYFNNTDKTYRTICKLGVSTDTYDSEGIVTNINFSTKLSRAIVSKYLKNFLGQREQKIPPFSAAKIKGIPYYKLARKGLKTPKVSRNVFFYELRIEKIELPYVQYVVKCSKGTYIRSMVNELGILLKVGAYLTSLERLACGNFFNTKNSISIDNLNDIQKVSDIPWISPSNLLNHLNTINADDEILSCIKFGKRVKLSASKVCIDFKTFEKEKVFEQTSERMQTKVLDINQNLIAIGNLLWENKVCYFQPSKVFI